MTSMDDWCIGSRFEAQQDLAPTLHQPCDLRERDEFFDRGQLPDFGASSVLECLGMSWRQPPCQDLETETE